jgi:NAD(P)-dependent dehydrogenase (short-subunit alcohol dehydrogenase family)
MAGTAALVTGGGSGIGLACARTLALAGAAVTICGRSEERLLSAVEEIGHGARHVVCDVTDESDVQRAVAVASEKTGALNVVVANAGATQALGPLPLIEVEAFRKDLDLNIIGAFLTIKHAAPALASAGGGAIVAVSSIAGVLTHPLMAPYSASKSGLEMLVRNAADELGAYRIRVNAIRPGLVPTDASDPLATNEATRNDYLAQMPLGRLGTVDDIANAVAFLVGPESSWITGQCLGVDGGHSVRRGPDLTSLVGGFFDEALRARMGTINGAS